MLFAIWMAADIAIPQGRFVNVTASSGLDAPSCSWGYTLGDYDQDGDPDLYLTNHIQRAMAGIGVPVDSVLYRNDGGLTFTALPRAAADASTVDAHHAAWVDVDRDGDLDLSVVQGTPKTNDDGALYHNRLFLNTDGQLKALPLEGDAAGIGWRIRGGLWTDLDQDGDADFVGAGVIAVGGRKGEGSLILRNDGPPSLVAAQAGTPIQRPTEETFQVSAADVNGDGRTDLLLTPPMGLYLQIGDGQWVDYTAASGLDTGLDVSNSHWGDFDNDGDQDLLVAVTNIILVRTKGGVYHPLGLRLYRNDGLGHFTDSTALLGGGPPVRTNGAVFGDVDNDGDLDIVRSGSEIGAPHGLLVNQGAAGGWAFVEAGAALGLRSGDKGQTADLGLADLDGDGRLDVLVTNGAGDCHKMSVGSTELWHNQLRTGHWLGVDLVGVRSEPNGLGAEVRILTAEGAQVRVKHGQHYLSQDNLPVHFGLGEATRVEAIEVRWPGGRVERFRGAPADQTLRLVEGQGNRVL